MIYQESQDWRSIPTLLHDFCHQTVCLVITIGKRKFQHEIS